MNTATIKNQIKMRDFQENRSRVIELAAYFDRISSNAGADIKSDVKLIAIRKALELLLKLDGNRTHAIQKLLSDGESQNSCC